MADRKITELTALAAGSQATGDLLAIVDVSETASANKNKKITVENLFKGIPGNVGVGTSSPSQKLHVNGTAYVADDHIRLLLDSGNGRLQIRSSSDTTNVDLFGSNGQAYFAGNVGIGTASPAGNLQISGSGDRSLLITGGTSGTTSVQMGDSSDADAGAILYDNSNNSMQFKTNASERMRIDSSGNVGIGTTSPNHNLHIFKATGDDVGIRIQNNDGFAELEVDADELNYNADSHVFNNQADSSEWMRINSSGNVGIGTSSPSGLLHLAASSEPSLYFEDTGSSNTLSRVYKTGSALTFNSRHTSAGQFVFNSENSGGTATERMRIDSSGRLLIGTSSSEAFNGIGGALQIEGTSNATTRMSLFRTQNDASASVLVFAKARNTSHAVLNSNDEIGKIEFYGADGNDTNQRAGMILCAVDATAGGNDMPGRLQFFTTPDGSTTPTERMRINRKGYMYLSTRNGIVDSNEHIIDQNQAAYNVLQLTANSNVYSANGGGAFAIGVGRTANSSYTFAGWYSGNGSDSPFNDREFRFRGDGNAYADGSFSGGGADYAEYFEWSDGNTDSEDRRGISVVLDGDKIRKAVDGEEPIGVISANPSVVGDADDDRWKNKYLRNDYGSYDLDENGDRQLNPAYDPDLEYISRENRPEWSTVGLMGKLRIRKGQVTGTRWIKMRDVSATVEEWLVR